MLVDLALFLATDFDRVKFCRIVVRGERNEYSSIEFGITMEFLIEKREERNRFQGNNFELEINGEDFLCTFGK